MLLHTASEWVSGGAKSYDPKGIATVPQDLVSAVGRFFGRGNLSNGPPSGEIHLLVTAECQGQQEQQDNEEERDALSDIGLQMYRSETLSMIRRYTLR
jgi:hypothetical protein